MIEGFVRALVGAKWKIALGVILFAAGTAIAAPALFPGAWRGLTEQVEIDKLKRVAP